MFTEYKVYQVDTSDELLLSLINSHKDYCDIDKVATFEHLSENGPVFDNCENSFSYSKIRYRNSYVILKPRIGFNVTSVMYHITSESKLSLLLQGKEVEIHSLKELALSLTGKEPLHSYCNLTVFNIEKNKQEDLSYEDYSANSSNLIILKENVSNFIIKNPIQDTLFGNNVVQNAHRVLYKNAQDHLRDIAISRATITNSCINSYGSNSYIDMGTMYNIINVQQTVNIDIIDIGIILTGTTYNDSFIDLLVKIPFNKYMQFNNILPELSLLQHLGLENESRKRLLLNKLIVSQWVYKEVTESTNNANYVLTDAKAYLHYLHNLKYILDTNNGGTCTKDNSILPTEVQKYRRADNTEYTPYKVFKKALCEALELEVTPAHFIKSIDNDRIVVCYGTEVIDLKTFKETLMKVILSEMDLTAKGIKLTISFYNSLDYVKDIGYNDARDSEELERLLDRLIEVKNKKDESTL